MWAWYKSHTAIGVQRHAGLRCNNVGGSRQLGEVAPSLWGHIRCFTFRPSFMMRSAAEGTPAVCSIRPQIVLRLIRDGLAKDSKK